MFRGVSAQFSGCGPAHAAYFSCYEGMKHALIAGRTGHHPAAHAAAGGFATLAHDGLMIPFDVVKQRMQLDARDAKGRRYRHFVQCARGVYRTEGVSAFFLSLPTTVRPSPATVSFVRPCPCCAGHLDSHRVLLASLQLVMNIPYQMCQFVTYEAIKIALCGEQTGVEHGGTYTPVVNLVSGGLAGGTAAAFTTPLDMVKTRLQTQGASGQHYAGALDAIRTIQAQEGTGAFFKGMGPRVLFHVPSMAICWSTYESIKFVLT